VWRRNIQKIIGIGENGSWRKRQRENGEKPAGESIGVVTSMAKMAASAGIENGGGSSENSMAKAWLMLA
jgi:hypothetical protein